jgi:2-dehydro-3-deoxyphosphogluconate aldolase / (4S)-4-hydroxy-2-oxoglutarate aldolase
MVSALTSYDDLLAHRLVPVVVADDVQRGLDVLKALQLSGINCVEVALRTSVSLDLLAEAAKLPGLLVGAGTVINAELLEKSLEAGAQFVVTPGLSDEVIRGCINADIPIFPGVATPTDAMRAIEHGLSYVKVFPVEQLGGLDFVKSLSGPFPDLKFMPSGGVNSTNFREYLMNRNVFAVSGSWMFPTHNQGPLDFEALKALSTEIEGLS